jgi:hypothetical protein
MLISVHYSNGILLSIDLLLSLLGILHRLRKLRFPKAIYRALGVNVPVRHYCSRDLIKAGQGKATTVWYLQGCKQAVRLVLDNIGSFR